MASLVGAARLRSFFLPDRGARLARPYAVVAAAGVTVAALLAATDPGQRAEWALYDVLSRRLSAGQAPAPDLVVVAIDEPSFAEIGLPWPWPRSIHAALVDELRAAGARTIAFDVLFDVPAADAEADEAFAAAIAGAGTVVLAADQTAIDDRGYVLTQWTDPIAPLAAASAGLGIVRIPFDPDGVLRRAWLTVDGRPSLALAIAARQPGFRAPDRSAEPRLIRFNGPPRHGIRTVSYYQALDRARSLPANLFTGRHVLVGRSLAATTIDQQADHFATPISARMSGVEIHATIADALLRDRFVADPFARKEAALFLALAAGAVIGAVLFPAGPLAGASLTVVGLVVVGIAGVAGLAQGTRIPVVGPAAAIAGAYLATATYRFALVARERRLVRRAFQHYVAPAIVDQMLDDPSRLRLGGSEYEVTVLFSDLEGFTALAERLGAEALGARLGEYFTAMLDVLLAERGTLDKLIGDAIMMYFGCPIADPRHAEQACRGALAMQRQMAALNADWAAHGLPPLRTRVGLNTGTVVAGNMGTNTIFNYTVLGDTVNVASRLEAVNKEYGTGIIIGEDTWARVSPMFDVRELDWIRVKGKTRPIAIYELVGEIGTLSEHRRTLLSRFADGLRAYRAGDWTAAQTAFASALALDPADGPSRTFAARSAALAAEAPPPSAWDGLYSITTK